MYPIINVFGKEIGTYGICVVVGIGACALWMMLAGRKKGVKPEDMILLMLSVAAGMFIGGHILYGITNISRIEELISHSGDYGTWEFIVTLFSTCFGGMVYYGGFIGGTVGLLIHTRFSKCIKLYQVIDIYAASVPLFHVFGRIGCFVGGCCYGIESSFGFTVHGNTVNPAINDVCRLPVQLFESGCELLIFGLLFLLYKMEALRGRLLYMYMLVYPVCRFILEFLRDDDIRGFVLGMSTSQFISIIIFAIGAEELIRTSLKMRREKRAAL